MNDISDSVIGNEKQLIIQQLLNVEFYKSSDDRQLYELTLQELKHEYNNHVTKRKL
ncbi:Fur-regulated basic protein FbpA [Domibacillus robiginosus]|uniref:Fur-regulated basic protein FbpA n=1 Tax=Domibacillus robiginosus TaxID=1071054 RepID=UPI0009E52F1E|nr:Fur-regulated basic protein FbpA [Domibacillus robiginosus]